MEVVREAADAAFERMRARRAAGQSRHFPAGGEQSLGYAAAGVAERAGDQVARQSRGAAVVASAMASSRASIAPESTTTIWTEKTPLGVLKVSTFTSGIQ